MKTKENTLLGLFALTLFTAAALMFAVQPMTGKMLLPLVGGTPAGWVVALAFFQIMLLLGYLLAHQMSRLPARAHGVAYLACLGAAAWFLPIHFPEGGVERAMDVFALLAATLGAPFIALAATSSTVQRLFTFTGHPAAQDPYFLYKASNLGSFAGLLLYPFVIEPTMTLAQQSRAMVFGYVLLGVFALLCTLLARRAAVAQTAVESAPEKTAWLRWLMLALVPSSLLLAVTTYITTDIVSAPLIWILPLAVYLMTFVTAFSRRPAISLSVAEKLQPYAITGAIILICLVQMVELTSWFGVFFSLCMFGIVALACHGQLAALRPKAEGRALTRYYLFISLGGAIGGSLNAFVLPHVFDRLLEFPLMLLAAFMLHPAFQLRTRHGIAYVSLLVAAVLLAQLPDFQIVSSGIRMMASSLALIGLLMFAPVFYRPLFQPRRLMMAALIAFMVSQYLLADDRFQLSMRNFYGTIRIYTTEQQDGDKTYAVRKLQHGSTIHGAQVEDPALEREPTTYYTKTGPLGDIFRRYEPASIAAIGLGAGAAFCYPATDRHFTFIEIDPAIVTVANKYFTFLDKCAQPTPARIITGDGRIELAKLAQEKFDLIILDAFTSDAIPPHLLTKEAFSLYRDRLTEKGVIAVHISNRYFPLWNTIATTAHTADLGAVVSVKNIRSENFYGTPSLWMIVAPKERLENLGAAAWRPVAPAERLRPWTDDYSDFLSLMIEAHAAWRLP